MQIGIVGYTLQAVAWLALASLLTARGAGAGLGRLLVATVVLQSLWGAAHALALANGPWLLVIAGVEAARPLVWSVMLLALLRTSVRGVEPTIGFAITVFVAAIQFALALVDTESVSQSMVALIGHVCTLLCVEQVYRNATAPYRWATKFLCLSVGAMAALDVAMYATAAAATGQVAPAIWIARGYAFALAAPLVAVTAARMPSWRLDVRVSRSVVFHSATLLITGLFLVGIAAASYGVHRFGFTHAAIVQVLLAFVAVVATSTIVASGRLRARLRVFVGKHFFSYRFDYRQEWLRLTAALARPDTEGSSLPQRALDAIIELVGGGGGAIWTLREDGRLRCDARRRVPDRDAIGPDVPLARFLATTGWIVDLDEWRRFPGRYRHLPLAPEIADDPDAWLLVPLMLDAELVGMIQLQRPPGELRIDWELRDVLKTAGRQVAGHLGVRLAVERLVQAQQFDSFNRMSAFVVHDLKNLVSQLSLLLGNASRHSDNPKFQEDMLDTVENVLDRMRGLLMQLRVGTRPVEQPGAVPLAKTLRAAAESKRNTSAKVTVEGIETLERLRVVAHEDRLERVVGHLVQNAIEASPPGGPVRIIARLDGDHAVVEIADEGCGMSREFIDTDLFRPFSTTKLHGMGIGAFESREYIRQVGGSLEVSSVEGEGSTFVVRLPVARDPVPMEQPS